MKLTKHDRVISDIVRLRTNFHCEGYKVFGFPECRRVDVNAQATYKSLIIQCSHFRGRGSGFVARHDTDNCRALCAYCHSYIECRPDDHAYLLRCILGVQNYEALRERCNRPYKAYRHEKEEMYQHYRSERERLITMRKQGEMGMIEVVNWFNREAA